MKLLVKFNLAFVAVFSLGLAATTYLAHEVLQGIAKEDVADRARLLMEKATVVSGYTATQIQPLLETQMSYEFLPQSVPSYSAAEVLGALQKTYPQYSFKWAMLNPTSPRDRAVEWEMDLISQFRSTPALKELVGQRSTPAGLSLYIARPVSISNPKCLVCHSTPEAAPKTMVARYGASNGFGWKLNETLGVQVVSVPMDVPLQRARQALIGVVGPLAAVFLLIGLVLNLMLWKMVIQPVRQLAALGDRVSLGELDAPEFAAASSDEIGVLATSFSRMRKSLTQAMKMLES